MEISQKLLCFLFLVSVAFGVLLGLCYDVLRITRILLGFHQGLPTPANQQENTKHHRLHYFGGRILLFLQDLLFGILCGVVVILILYFVNDGQLRFLAPFGMACGFFVYTFTLGKLICAVSEVIAEGIRRIIKWLVMTLYKVISLPVKWIYRLLDRVILSRVRRVIYQRKEKKKILYTQQQMDQLKNHAAKCFDMFDDP